VGTLQLVNSFDITQAVGFGPTGLEALSNGEFWFSGLGTGQIGRMIYTGTQDYQFTLYDLPITELWSLDIEADAAGDLWIVAHAPGRLVLPVMLKPDAP
jgi:hypothetical protein